MYIGCDITKKYGILNGLKALKEINGNACQIHLKDTTLNFIETKTEIEEEEIKSIKKFVKDNDIYMINHSIYKVNIARPLNELLKGLTSVIDDINLTTKMGGIGSVIHMGKKTNLSYDDAINNSVENLRYIINNIKDGYVLLENSAGEGTALYTIEDMGLIMSKLTDTERKKVRFVVDTCHSFTAGYDLTTKKEMDKFIGLLEKHLGIENIACIHLNDSYEPLGSRKDRHQNLLLGHISNKSNSLKQFKKFIKWSIKNNLPLILETDPCLHIAEIQFLKGI